MQKRRGKGLNSIFCNPLPVTLVVDQHGQLPLVTVCNVVSWINMIRHILYVYLQPAPPAIERRIKVIADVVEEGLANWDLSKRDLPKRDLTALDLTDLTVGTVIFRVNDELDMTRLWSQGFFGKGNLSRSEPSWKLRVLRRSGLASENVTREDVTLDRRIDRKQFKKLRNEVQKLEALSRQRDLTVDEKFEMSRLRQLMEKDRGRDGNSGNGDSQNSGNGDSQNSANEEPQNSANGDSENSELEVSIGDSEKSQNPPNSQTSRIENHHPQIQESQNLKILTNPEKIPLQKSTEWLQLQPSELMFLHLLDAVTVIKPQNSDATRELSTEEILTLCMEKRFKPDASNPFLINYVVYHHFRSLGWCVRNGIKFGCNWILYQKGPPFLHAEYALLTIPKTNGPDWIDWSDFMAVARVVGGVKKTLVLVFVDIVHPEMAQMILLAPIDRVLLARLLSCYKVTEVVYRRWSPSRTRD